MQTWAQPNANVGKADLARHWLTCLPKSSSVRTNIMLHARTLLCSPLMHIFLFYLYPTPCYLFLLTSSIKLQTTCRLFCFSSPLVSKVAQRVPTQCVLCVPTQCAPTKFCTNTVCTNTVCPVSTNTVCISTQRAPTQCVPTQCAPTQPRVY